MIRLQRKNGVVLLDDEDAWVLKDYYLKATRQQNYEVIYALSRESRKQTTLARVLLGITDKSLQADHINQDGYDNRRENLRVVDLDLQSANRSSTNSWGYKGVYSLDGGIKYRSKFFRRGVRYYSGVRHTPEQAALDYNRMAIAVWGHQIMPNEVRCVGMEPRPADRNCMFCNAPCHCCCVCFDQPTGSMQKLFDTFSA